MIKAYYDRDLLLEEFILIRELDPEDPSAVCDFNDLIMIVEANQVFDDLSSWGNSLTRKEIANTENVPTVFVRKIEQYLGVKLLPY